MKNILCLSAILLTSCVSRESTINTTPATHEESPPNTFSAINDNDIAILKEEQSYQLSVSKIEDKFKKEYLDYNICLEANGPGKDCTNLLQRYCIISVLIDARGGHHFKPYCSFEH